MTFCIVAPWGTYYTNDADSLESLRLKLEGGTALKCWWVVGWGQWCIETCWFHPDSIQMIRTESEAVIPPTVQP